MSVLEAIGIILGSCVGYLLVGVFTSALLVAKFAWREDNGGPQIAGLFWPVAFPFILVSKVAGYLNNEIQYRLNKDMWPRRRDREAAKKALPKATALR